MKIFLADMRIFDYLCEVNTKLMELWDYGAFG